MQCMPCLACRRMDPVGTSLLDSRVSSISSKSIVCLSCLLLAGSINAAGMRLAGGTQYLKSEQNAVSSRSACSHLKRIGKVVGVRVEEQRRKDFMMRGGLGAPARTPTQVDRKRREVVSGGLRSCPSIARRSSTTNCVTQLRTARDTPQLDRSAAPDATCKTLRALLNWRRATESLSRFLLAGLLQSVCEAMHHLMGALCHWQL